MSSRVPKPLRRIAFLAVLSLSALTGGALGFHWIEGQSLFDSFYMALITLTTVGYEETFELSEAGRWFNALLILTGFTLVFVSLGVLVDLLVQMELLNYFERRRTRRMIRKQFDHYIVCGLGRVGRGVLRELARSGAAVVAIDKSAKHEAWTNEQQVPLLVADATLDSVLVRAGAERAKGLVAAISSDAINVYVTLSARDLNPDLKIAARASDEDAQKKLLRAGAQTAFTPYSYVGYRLAQALLRPHVSSFLDISSVVGDEETEVEIDQVAVGRDAPAVGRALGELSSGHWADLIVLAVTRPSRKVVFKPPSDTRLEADDVLILMGPRSALEGVRPELEP